MTEEQVIAFLQALFGSLYSCPKRKYVVVPENLMDMNLVQEFLSLVFLQMS